MTHYKVQIYYLMVMVQYHDSAVYLKSTKTHLGKYTGNYIECGHIMWARICRPINLTIAHSYVMMTQSKYKKIQWIHVWITCLEASSAEPMHCIW